MMRMAAKRALTLVLAGLSGMSGLSALASALGVGTLVCVTACGTSTPASAGATTATSSATLVDPEPLITEAHAVLRTDPPRAFALLGRACEVGQSTDACIEAEAMEPSRGRALIIHGCVLGSPDACSALYHSELTREHKPDAVARADVTEALDLGCAEGVAPACATRPDIDASLALTKLLADPVRASPRRSTVSHHASEVCAEACTARRATCVRRCEVQGDSDCATDPDCAAEERRCDMGCQSNAAVTCRVELEGRCGPLT